MSFIPGMHPGPALIRPPEIYYRGAYNDGPVNNQSSYTWTNAPLGDAHPSRKLHIVTWGFHLGATLTSISSCTVDGNAATYEAGQNSPGTGTSLTSHMMWSLPWPTGTTADIAWARAGGSMAYGFAALWTSYYVRGSAPYAAAWDGGGATPNDFSQNVLANSVMCAHSRFGTATANCDVEWTAGVTEDAESVFTSGGQREEHLMGSFMLVPAASPRTLEVENIPTGVGPQVVFQIWK